MTLEDIPEPLWTHQKVSADTNIRATIRCVINDLTVNVGCGCGGENRRLLTGACAKGIPRKAKER